MSIAAQFIPDAAEHAHALFAVAVGAFLAKQPYTIRMFNVFFFVNKYGRSLFQNSRFKHLQFYR